MIVTMDSKEILNPSRFKFSYDSPTIISSTTVGHEGGSISLQGISFGKPNSIVVGNRECVNITFTFTSINCSLSPFNDNEEIPIGNQTIIVNIDSLIGTYDRFQYDNPRIRNYG